MPLPRCKRCGDALLVSDDGLKQYACPACARERLRALCERGGTFGLDMETLAKDLVGLLDFVGGAVIRHAADIANYAMMLADRERRR